MSKRPTPGQAHRELAIVLAPGHYSHAAVVRAATDLEKVVKTAKRKGRKSKKKARRGRGKHRVLFRRVKRVNRCPYCRKKIRGGRTGLAQHLAYQHDGRGVSTLMGRTGHWSTHSYPSGKKPRGRHPGRKKHPRVSKSRKSRKKARKGRPSKRSLAAKRRYNKMKREGTGLFAHKRGKKKSRKASKKKSRAKSKSRKKVRKPRRSAHQKAATARLVEYNRLRKAGHYLPLFPKGVGRKPTKAARKAAAAARRRARKASRQLSKVNWEGIGAAMQAGQTGYSQGDVAGYHRSQMEVRADLERAKARAVRREKAIERLVRIRQKRASLKPRTWKEAFERSRGLSGLSEQEKREYHEARKAGLVK